MCPRISEKRFDPQNAFADVLFPTHLRDCSSWPERDCRGIANALMQVADSAKQVAEDSQQIAGSSQAVSQRASEQASSLEETSSSLDESPA
jgi:hypothetical protein